MLQFKRIYHKNSSHILVFNDAKLSNVEVALQHFYNQEFIPQGLNIGEQTYCIQNVTYVFCLFSKNDCFIIV